MTKLEKLREINATLDEILIKKETYIFIENIDANNKMIIKEQQLRVIAEIK